VKNTEALTDAIEKVCLEVNTMKVKFMLSHHQNAWQNNNIKIPNRFFENVGKFKYLGVTVTNQYFIYEEIMSRLNSGNSCYHSVQNLFFFSSAVKNIKMKLCQNYN
jgi:hypothetical protein